MISNCFGGELIFLVFNLCFALGVCSFDGYKLYGGYVSIQDGLEVLQRALYLAHSITRAAQGLLILYRFGCIQLGLAIIKIHTVIVNNK